MASKKQKYRVNVREFLNLKGQGGGAYIMASVDDTSGDKCSRDSYTSTSLTIADCSTVIDLALSVRPGAGIRNTRHKLTVLIETLQKVLEGCEAESKLIEERKKTTCLCKECKERAPRKKASPKTVEAAAKIIDQLEDEEV